MSIGGRGIGHGHRGNDQVIQSQSCHYYLSCRANILAARLKLNESKTLSAYT
jgi:hypothetical protein